MSMTPEELERVYDKPDPWGYQTNPADEWRARKIIGTLEWLCGLGEIDQFDRALDIACGEGWITQFIPAKEIFGFEVSMQAIKRWPSNIKLFGPIQFEAIPFDLVLMTGCLYENYDWEKMCHIATLFGTKYIVTCNIADREHQDAISMITAGMFATVHIEEFPYDRGDEKFTQRLRIFRR